MDRWTRLLLEGFLGTSVHGKDGIKVRRDPAQLSQGAVGGCGGRPGPYHARMAPPVPRPSLRRFGAEVILAALLAAVLVGCGRNAAVPPGAQVVHVVATESEVRLDPTVVHAGAVYLVLDEPLDGAFDFVSLKRTASATPGPMSDDDLERLARGDTEGTSSEAFSVGCSPTQQAESRGQTGPCGNAFGPFPLTPGKYAILGPGWTMMETEPSVDPTADPTGLRPPPTMAVLEVVP